MIRVTIRLQGETEHTVDDVERVTQLVPGCGGKDVAKSASGSEILHFQFVPWRTTIVEGKTKVFSVDPLKIASIEAELI
jgi:hypothetical protein|nr:MAG TPA: hypothetical protein [Caudoviricetes sp.]